MKKQYNYYIIGILVTTILVFMGGYYVFFNTMWNKAKVISEYKNDIIIDNQKRQYADDMIKTFENIKDKREKIDDFFVKKQGEVDFIEYVEKVARDQSLEVEVDAVEVDLSKEASSYGMEYLILRFNVKGSWINVWNFSRTLESLPYSIDVSNMILQRENVNEKSSPIWKGIYRVSVLKKS
ncbi:MAG: hypothetical protein ACYCZW_03515 [Minisyncoccota bacterium]